MDTESLILLVVSVHLAFALICRAIDPYPACKREPMKPLDPERPWPWFPPEDKS